MLFKDFQVANDLNDLELKPQMLSIFKSRKQKIADAVLGMERGELLGKKAVKALLAIPPLELRVEMGPYCNMNCSFCYGDYGPHREEYMKPNIMKLLMSQIKDTDITRLTLSDGEPTHNKDNLMEILDHIDGFPTHIFTNGMFAKTYESAKDMLESMKKHKFSTAVPKQKIPGLHSYSGITVSADRYHGEASYGWAINLARAFRDTFKGKGLPIHGLLIHNVQPKAVSPEDAFTNEELNEKFVKPFEAIYGELYKLSDEIIPLPGYILANREFNVPIAVVGLNKIGRAKNLPGISERKLEDINFEFAPSDQREIFLRHNGDVYAGGGSCTSSGRLLGNIKEKPLKQMCDEYMVDPAFQIFKLGGVKGVLSALEKKGYQPGITATGACDACKQIFADPKALSLLRE